MALSQTELTALTEKARTIRKKIIRYTQLCGGSHVGGAFSQTDILVTLYHKYMKIDPKRPDWPERDRFILSKGHGGIGHAVVLGDLGYFPESMLEKFNKTDSPFGMHLDRMKVPGVDASTGSLGHGLAIGLGMAMGAKLNDLPWHTYIVCSDGECHEGTIWEAALAGAQFNITNATVFIDRNKFTIDGPTEDIMRLEPLHEKWEAFGWRALRIDGHDFHALADAIDAAHAETQRPTVVICDTVKGKGVDWMENNKAWHYGGLDDETAAKALAALDGSPA